MKIEKVSVTYGELRSAGYPTFSNKRHEITLEASLQPGDSARTVKEKLSEIAKREVKRAFEDPEIIAEMELPF